MPPTHLPSPRHSHSEKSAPRSPKTLFGHRGAFFSGEQKKTKNTKYTNIFLAPLAGHLSQEKIPPAPGTNGTKRQTHWTVKQKLPVCPRTISICPRDGSCPNCLCLLGFILPDFQTLALLMQALIPLSMLFSQKSVGQPEKKAVSLFFCPFLRFFGPKTAPFPCFRIFYPRFFRQNCAFLSPQMPFALQKMRG